MIGDGDGSTPDQERAQGHSTALIEALETKRRIAVATAIRKRDGAVVHLLCVMVPDASGGATRAVPMAELLLDESRALNDYQPQAIHTVYWPEPSDEPVPAPSSK